MSRVIDLVARAVAAGVDMVQIRERDLSARELSHFTEAAAKLSKPAGTLLLVNDRADIAVSAGAGVHLTTRSLTADVVRRTFGPEMIIGASTHNLDEAYEAERGGADFVVFGPVFETGSKKEYGPPVGIEALRAVTGGLSIPVLALGGVSSSNFRQTLEAGAAGIAGISIFSEARDLASLVSELRS